MLSPSYARQFKKDYRLVGKRGYKLEKLKHIMTLLLEEKQLPQACCEHELIGEWKGVFDVHVESDWLLLFRRLPGVIHFERTGSHSDLFD